MAKVTRNFVAGKMNKVIDQRLIPEGEYIDAMNIRMGSTEMSEVGVIENTKGNSNLTSLIYIDGTPLSVNARCIGAIEDSTNNKIYWFVHDPAFYVSGTGKLDLIVSFNVFSNILTYHVISINDGSGINTTLNFNPNYLITGVNIIGDLLFFTDDYNEPRFINITTNYPNPILNIDQFSAEKLLVIKKPPIESPTVKPIVTNGQSNYMDTRFISFAYRYRYADGEYSATSQWSQISFVPKPFEFSINSMLNEGMTNLCNSAIITYNTGGPLVVGIDLLFKQSYNNIIKVIEKLDKADLGIPNDVEQQYQFTNSKIFTILSDTELLRLYDNVPLKAKAQTIMGNRLMYGNYVEGFNLTDKYGQPTKFEYTTKLINEVIGTSNAPDSLSAGIYNIQTIGLSVNNSIVSIDLDGKDLVAGAAINIEMTIAHSQFSGDTPFPSETTDSIGLSFNFILSTNYSSVYALASSPEFQLAVGTAANIKPVFSSTPGVETSCDGTTFTDDLNCVLPNNLDSLTKYASGIGGVGQPIAIITSPGSTEIGFQLIAMQYVNNTTTPTQFVYEYYEYTFASATFQEISNPQSLHSNRGYEIGIVYMDEFNRATTTLVSPNNTEHIACGFSANKNSIQVSIPPTQIAPAFASRYKFVIKPDEENYEVIYCNLFFTDPDTNEVWFLLEGENATKIEVGDRLIVKADTDGPVTSCAYATVLEKASKASGFITPIEGVEVLGGVYMKINPNSFSAVVDPNATIAPGLITTFAGVGGNYAVLDYPMNIADPANPGQYLDYSVPAGSRIKFDIKWERTGRNSQASCEKKGYVLQKIYTVSRDYDNMQDWFVGDNIAATLDNGVDLNPSSPTSLQFIPTTGPLTTFNFDICYLQFNRLAPIGGGDGQLILQTSTGRSCTGFGADYRRYYIDATITVFRAIDTIIFETEPSNALPDVWYENNLSFAIDKETGFHEGNVQNQTGSVPAIIDTGFFNCFAFGNGAESYKIRDSLIGKGFALGERVTSVSAQDYKQSDRFADITYSGIYNAESNVNKLNQFNLGLLNYKNLETSFGDIQVIDGRQTDVLVLQEDKISYVLADKNLLSDSTGGGAVTSVPEVLGTQIARTEKYGISFNPESYVQWGADRFFTDTKRGTVLQLRGDSYSSDQLKVISESGMRTWFRDLFNNSNNTQKLGGYDPYMNEYVLSSNEQALPSTLRCLSCGVSQTFTLSSLEEYAEFTYCVDLGPTVGFTDVTWNVDSISEGGEFQITVCYNGDCSFDGYTTEGGSITFNKDQITVENAFITISYIGTVTLNVLADCCNAQEISIVQVVLTNDADSGDTIHSEYRFTNGAFVSPLQSTFVIFNTGTSNPLVSLYNITTGFVGSGAFPPEGSDMRLISNKFVTDSFVFNPSSNAFKYATSNTLYANTSVDISSLLSISTTATPNQGGGDYNFADFTVPALDDYLYLIWDLRSSTETTLCFGSDITDVCCECVECGSPNWQVQFLGENGTQIEYYPYEGSAPLYANINSGDTICCQINTFPIIIEGSGSFSIFIACGCDIE